MSIAGSEQLRYCASRTIRHADVGGCRVILDLRTAQYQVLDAVASRMWTALTSDDDLGEVTAALSDEYGVPRARILADLEGLAGRCIRDGFLEAGDSSLSHSAEAFAERTAGRPRTPTVATALYCLLMTERALRKEGFASVYLRYDGLARGANAGGVEGALKAFRRAENFHLAARGSDDCLARSLALFRFLNGAGVRAEHVIGVCRFPFRAHAWVEVEGRPLLEASTTEYTRLAWL